MLCHHYHLLVKVIDYARIIPKLEEWCDIINDKFPNAEEDTFFFTDGKPWKLSRPGKGAGARVIAQIAGTTDINLVQKAYYNGHYGFHGAKIQHVTQVDGIMYSFCAPIRKHDSRVLKTSSMFTILAQLYINNNVARPVKTVTDKAYPRNQHLRPAYTRSELAAMPPVEKLEKTIILKQNNKKRIVVEFTFNNILTKFNYFDSFRKFRITQDGQNNWAYIHAS